MDSIVQYYDKYPYDNAVESTCKTNTVQFKGLSISFIESHTKHPWNLTHAHTHTLPLSLFPSVRAKSVSYGRTSQTQAIIRRFLESAAHFLLRASL